MKIPTNLVVKAAAAFKQLKQRAIAQRFNQIAANDALTQRLAVASEEAQKDAAALYALGKQV